MARTEIPGSRVLLLAIGMGLISACAPVVEPAAPQQQDRVAAEPAVVAPVEAEARPAGASDALLCLTQTVYFEARGRPEKDLRAVAHVVLNRVRHRRFPGTICGVVRQGGARGPCQFSWYCDGRSDKMRDGSERRRAEQVASAALAGSSQDPTGGAQFFHNQSVSPSWSRRLKRTVRIGPHTFYRYP
jgi:spore germination cell wall hydrolase CwlJ-like protein